MRYRSPEIRIHRILQFTFFILHLLLLACGCEKSATNPPPPPPDKPDTTSHDFTWRIDTIGAGNTVLFDVAIIDENDIWVVGDIRIAGTPAHNALHWNGQEWELKRFNQIWNGQQFPILPIQGVLPIDSNDIWLAAGSVYHWDGNSTSLSYMRDITTPESITKLWNGFSLYGVGTEGLIIYNTGSGWQRIASGTTIAIQDVWGIKHPQSGEEEIYCIASNVYYGGDNKVLKTVNGAIQDVSNAGLRWSINGIWFDKDSGYYIVGDGIFYTRTLNDTSRWVELVPDITTYYTHAVRGNQGNDIFVVGAFGTMIHYNGKTWKNYTGVELPVVNGNLYRVDVKGNIVVGVGVLPPRGYIVMGRRTNR